MRAFSEWKQRNLFTHEWEPVRILDDVAFIVSALLKKSYAVYLENEGLWVVGAENLMWAAPGSAWGLTCDNPVVDGHVWPNEDVFDAGALSQIMITASMTQGCVAAAFNQRAGFSLSANGGVSMIDLLGPTLIGKACVENNDVVLCLNDGRRVSLEENPR